jgi:hypothetical protein
MLSAPILGDASQGAFEGDAGAAPQFSGGVVPDDLVFVFVVVTVEAQGRAEGFVGGVDAIAAQVDAVGVGHDHRRHHVVVPARGRVHCLDLAGQANRVRAAGGGGAVVERRSGPASSTPAGRPARLVSPGSWGRSCVTTGARVVDRDAQC